MTETPESDAPESDPESGSESGPRTAPETASERRFAGMARTRGLKSAIADLKRNKLSRR